MLLCGLTILLSSTFTTMYHQDHVEVSRPIVDGANKMNVLDAPPPGQLDGQMKRNAGVLFGVECVWLFLLDMCQCVCDRILLQT